MISRREILDTSHVLGLLPQVVEKDYVLGWILAGIYQHAALKETWIFKGGDVSEEMLLRNFSILRRP